jgi:hypothetical protein
MVVTSIQVDLIAHRGLWSQPEEKNTPEALRAALTAGFGIETDVRDYGSRLVISHDPPLGSEPSLEDLLVDYCRCGNANTLAINIKADGLAEELLRLLQAYGVSEYFCFDMSVPDLPCYTKLNMPVFARRSEFEPPSPLTERAPGIWLDGFEGLWFDHHEWARWLAQGKSVCIVSPELHKRSHFTMWSELLDWLHDVNRGRFELETAAGRLMLCTDLPHDFRVFQCK